MGFGSFGKKFKKLVSGGGAALGGALYGGSVGGPIGALVGLSAGGVAGSLFGGADADEEISALRRAGRMEEAQRLALERYGEQIREETAPFREQGQAELARLQGQRPGDSEFYKQALSRGTESIAEQRNRFGLASSGRTGTQFEELGSNLLLQEELARQQGIGRAANLAQTGYSPALNALQQQGGAAYRQAQTEASIGALRTGASAANRNAILNAGSQIGGAYLGNYLSGGNAPINTSGAGTNVGQNTWEIPY